jgi:hypothetical protein
MWLQAYWVAKAVPREITICGQPMAKSSQATP